MPGTRIAAAVLALAAVSGCVADEGGGPTSAPCPTPSSTVSRLPAGFPVLADQVLLERVTQGKTTVLVGAVPGEDFVEVRDKLVQQLRDKGYTIVGTDQESVEAEAEFGGPRRGTIRVQPRCAGQLSVRYTFND